jgi:hypothetical protein
MYGPCYSGGIIQQLGEHRVLSRSNSRGNYVGQNVRNLAVGRSREVSALLITLLNCRTGREHMPRMTASGSGSVVHVTTEHHEDTGISQ